jgi:sodium/potassium-transporting ATPase subunit alpha
VLSIDVGTDMLPAIALAYEEAESDNMRRPPRRAHKDKLVDMRLIGFGYFQIGIIHSMAGLFAFLCVMASHGFPPYTLLGLSSKWRAFLMTDSSPVKDVLGRVVNAEQQNQILMEAQTAYFLAVVETQCANLLIVKTRHLSIFTQGMRFELLLMLDNIVEIGL